jgi:predicted Zn finger-like uncharacterized protein
MAINTFCPECRAAYQLADTQKGKKVRCKHCDAAFIVAESPSQKAAIRKGPDTGTKAVPRGKPVAVTTRRGAATRKERDEDEVRVEARPQQGNKHVLAWVLGCGLLGVGLAVVLTGGIVLYFMLSKDDAKQVANATPPPPPLVEGPQAQLQGQPINNLPRGNQPPVPRPGGRPAAPDQPVQGQPVAQPPAPANADPSKEIKNPPPVEEEPRNPAPAGNGQLTRQARDRVTAATVYLRVTQGDGTKMAGTGFFGCPGAKNIVLTNAHVVGMLSPESSRPKSIEVFVHSGEANEWKTSARVLGVDRSSDLAVLDIGSPPSKTPEPLTVKSAGGLQTLDTLYVFGFPFGEQLGKEITVNQTSVSSLRKKNGVLDRVQVNGGMNPGNSGGPLIDASGAVVGVAVSGIPGRQINFAIPGERVHAILEGRVSGLSFHQPYISNNNKVAVPVLMEMIDPRNLVKEVGVEIWSGDEPADKQAGRRPPSTTQPPRLAGDSERVAYKLKYLAPEGRAEIVLPDLPSGKVYWHQPRWINAKGQTQWAAASVLKLASQPVERQPVNLVLRYPRGASRPLNLTLDNSFKVSNNDDTDTARTHTEVDLTETVESSGPRGSQLGLRYRGMPKRELLLPGKPASPSARLEQIKADLARFMKSHQQIDSAGNITQEVIDQQALLPLLQSKPQQVQVMTSFHQFVLQGLESLSLSFPARDSLNPLDSWKAERRMPIDTPGKLEVGHLDVTYTYLGVRTREGRREAVISMDGIVRGKGDGISGQASGQILVDVNSGQTILAKSKVVLQLDALLSEPGEADRLLRVILTMDARLKRSL